MRKYQTFGFLLRSITHNRTMPLQQVRTRIADGRRKPKNRPTRRFVLVRLLMFVTKEIRSNIHCSTFPKVTWVQAIYTFRIMLSGRVQRSREVSGRMQGGWLQRVGIQFDCNSLLPISKRQCPHRCLEFARQNRLVVLRKVKIGYTLDTAIGITTTS